jgi:predicted nucleic acid-binding Zn ribbon protein
MKGPPLLNVEGPDQGARGPSPYTPLIARAAVEVLPEAPEKLAALMTAIAYTDDEYRVRGNVRQHARDAWYTKDDTAKVRMQRVMNDASVMYGQIGRKANPVEMFVSQSFALVSGVNFAHVHGIKIGSAACCCVPTGRPCRSANFPTRSPIS